MVANTMIVITTASTSGPLLSLREGIAVLHNWAAKPNVSNLDISDLRLRTLQIIHGISQSFTNSPTRKLCQKTRGYQGELKIKRHTGLICGITFCQDSVL